MSFVDSSWKVGTGLTGCLHLTRLRMPGCSRNDADCICTTDLQTTQHHTTPMHTHTHQNVWGLTMEQTLRSEHYHCIQNYLWLTPPRTAGRIGAAPTVSLVCKKRNALKSRILGNARVYPWIMLWWADQELNLDFKILAVIKNAKATTLSLCHGEFWRSVLALHPLAFVVWGEKFPAVQCPSGIWSSGKCAHKCPFHYKPAWYFLPLTLFDPQFSDL